MTRRKTSLAATSTTSSKDTTSVSDGWTVWRSLRFGEISNA